MKDRIQMSIFTLQAMCILMVGNLLYKGYLGIDVPYEMFYFWGGSVMLLGIVSITMSVVEISRNYKKLKNELKE